MVSNPAQWVTSMKQAGASQFTFHFEAVNNQEDESAIHSLIDDIKTKGLKCGLAIKPKTPVNICFILDIGL